MNNMISEIIKTNEENLLKRKDKISIQDLEKRIKDLPKSLDFYGSFKNFGVIAEIKLASPSSGDLADESQVPEIAKAYLGGKANAISIITEKYFFKGDIEFINQVKEITGLPILQKDFVVDSYQIYESRAFGADALLLIAKIISPMELRKFVDLCLEIGIEPVVEINDEVDLENAMYSNTRVIAVNSRNLDTFRVNIEKACELLKKVPSNFLKLGFSGVSSKEEVGEYRKAGAKGVLIGTSLMKAEKKKEFLEELK